MARRIAVGVAWWLAIAYAFQFAAVICGLPLGVGPILAIPLAVLVARVYRPRLGQAKDRRRIYEVPEDAPVAGAKPATWPR